jgi:outer membrane protein TolC
MRSIALFVVLLPGLAAADSPKLTLEQVIAKAIANPRVQMAKSDRDAAGARVREADAARYPRIKATAFGTISPEITCRDPGCTMTDPQNFAWTFDGIFGGAQVDLTQPLYTFGKIEHARRAARAGLEAQQALANEAAGDAAADAARAYWGLKLAREMGYMLDDGIETITKAQANFNEKKDATIQDRQRVAVLLAEAKVQRAEAAQLEAQALAGLRALVNMPDADIDDAELLPVDHEMFDPAQVVEAAKQRPQSLAATSGARAAAELAAFQAAHYFPDLALVGSAVIARAQGVDDPPSAFANDPYNRSGAALLLGLQWQLEPWTVKARTDRARAEAHKMQAQSALAALGATYDANLATSEARTAKDKLDAATEGEKAAKGMACIGLAKRGRGHRRGQGSRRCLHRLVSNEGPARTSHLPMERRRGTSRPRYG